MIWCQTIDNKGKGCIFCLHFLSRLIIYFDHWHSEQKKILKSCIKISCLVVALLVEITNILHIKTVQLIVRRICVVKMSKNIFDHLSHATLTLRNDHITLSFLKHCKKRNWTGTLNKHRTITDKKLLTVGGRQWSESKVWNVHMEWHYLQKNDSIGGQKLRNYNSGPHTKAHIQTNKLWMAQQFNGILQDKM